jgi:glutaredoxin 3
MSDMPKVEIYTTHWCPYCDAAKHLLERKGFAYEERDAQSQEGRQEMIQRAHGRRTVPQIFVDEKHLGGYDDLAALERDNKLEPMLRGGV